MMTEFNMETGTLSLCDFSEELTVMTAVEKSSQTQSPICIDSLVSGPSSAAHYSIDM